MANMLILFYMFCGGKLEDNLVGIFNLFDADGNKVDVILLKWKLRIDIIDLSYL